MTSRLWKTLIVVVLLFALGIPLIVQAETFVIEDPLVAASVGLYDADGSVLYSVLAGSGENDLADLTITSTLPAGATFVDVVDMPASATFVGEADGTVTWQLAALPANSVIGPFTYRVTFADAMAEAPANVAAMVTWADGSASAEVSEGTLPHLEDSGSIMVDVAGTDGLVAVGNTGILVAIPADAMSQPATLTFTRLPIDAEIDLQTAETAWWCFMVQISSDVEVEISQPITLVVPNRRALTPGLELLVGLQDASGEWQLINEAPTSYLKSGYAEVAGQDAKKLVDNLVAYNGIESLVSYSTPPLSPAGAFLQAGVATSKKEEGMVSLVSYSTPPMIIAEVVDMNNFLGEPIVGRR